MSGSPHLTPGDRTAPPVQQSMRRTGAGLPRRPLTRIDGSISRFPSWPTVHLLVHLRAGLDRRRLLAFGLAGIVALVTQRVIADADAARNSIGMSESVVVVTRDLPSGHMITDGDYSLRDRPHSMLPQAIWRGEPTGQILNQSILANEVLVDSHIGVGPFGLTSNELAVTIPPPLAPPPLEIGHQVLLLTVAAPNGAFIRSANTISTGRILVVSSDAITIAVPNHVASKVVDALAVGSIELILTPG